MSSKLVEKGFDYMITGTAIFAMALMTAAVSFLWNVSKSIQVLNSQVAVVIEQVSGNEKNVSIQLATHEKMIDLQSAKIESMTDQLRILNTRVEYITRYVNDHEKELRK